MIKQTLNASNLYIKPAQITVCGFRMMGIIQPAKFKPNWAIENTDERLRIVKSCAKMSLVIVFPAKCTAPI